jgi:hypothetical protein
MMSAPATAAADKADPAVHQGGKIAATTAALRGGCSVIKTSHSQLHSISAPAPQNGYQERPCVDGSEPPLGLRLDEIERLRIARHAPAKIDRHSHRLPMTSPVLF